MGYNYAYIRSEGLTDVGRVRQHNEDAFGFDASQGWFCVADGMGGEEAGEVASAQVVQSIKDSLATRPDQEGVDNLHTKQELIERGLIHANRAIREYVARKGLKQSGSTAVLLAFDFCQPGRALTAHVGDSRIYRMRRGNFEQITVDHSVAAAAGLSNEDDIPVMFRGMVTRAIGIKEDVEVECQSIDIEVGDLYLLCSDGLSGMVNDRKLAKRLRHVKPTHLADVVSLLIADANAGGGKDNISAILVQIGESEMFAPPAEQLTRLVLPPREAELPDPLGDPDSEDTLFTAPRADATTDRPSAEPTAHTVPLPAPAPTPAPTVRAGEPQKIEPGMPTQVQPTEEPHEPSEVGHFLKEKMYLILFGIAIIGLLAYMGYIGFIKETPEIDTGAFPKAPDDATVLSQLGKDSAPRAPVSRIDLADGQAIRNALQTGEWGPIREAHIRGAQLPHGELRERADHWMGRWDLYLAQPDIHYQSYTNFHAGLLRTGEKDRFTSAYFLTEPAENAEQRANELCQFQARFDQQVAPMLDALAMRLSELVKLIEADGHSLPAEVTQVYAMPSDQLNASKIQAMLPKARQLQQSLQELAEMMRGTGSSSAALRSVNHEFFTAFGLAATDYVNQLHQALGQHSLSAMKSQIDGLPESIRSVGQDLLGSIERAQTDLDVAHGAQPGPLDFTALEKGFPLYHEFHRAIRAFSQWHAPEVEVPKP